MRDDEKENYSSNLSHFKQKSDEIPHIIQKPKKQLGEKTFDKFQNCTPTRKGTKTPKNITPGKSNQNTTQTKVCDKSLIECQPLHSLNV